MKEDVKDLWVAALRSGEYEQGKGKLCVDGKFCCLGVLCEVLKVPAQQFARDPSLRLYGERRADEWLPSEAIDAAGFADCCGWYKSADSRQKSLTAINDDGVPFSEIANIIEANWRTL